MNRGIVNGSVERQIQLWRDFRRINVVAGWNDPMIHQTLARFGRWRLCHTDFGQLATSRSHVHSGFRHTGRSLRRHPIGLKNVERTTKQRLCRRTWLTARDAVDGGPHLNIYGVILFVQVQRHCHVIERRIGRNRNTETLRKIDGESPWNEGEKSPVEVRLPAHLLIVFSRGAAAFSKSEIGMTEKLLRDWLLPGRVDDFSFDTCHPLHPRFFRHAEVDSSLYRPRSLHGAVNLV